MLNNKNRHRQQWSISKLPGKKYYLYVIVFVLLIIAVWPRQEQLKLGIDIAQNANTTWLIVAILSLSLVFVTSACVYQTLAKKKLKIINTIFVEVSSAFANKIIPGGIGGISLNIDYLIKAKHSAQQATSVVAMNSIVAVVSHLLMLMIAIIIGKSTFNELFQINPPPVWTIIIILLLIIILGVVLLNNKFKKRIKIFLIGVFKQIKMYKKQPNKIILGIVGASFITIFLVFALYACAQAVGMPLTLIQAFLAFTVSTILGVAFFTPGGLGGVEAGLFASFIIFGYDPVISFSVVILFRLISFWLPIIPGYISFLILRRLKIV